jgi:hypothetical protein
MASCPASFDSVDELLRNRRFRRGWSFGRDTASLKPYSASSAPQNIRIAFLDSKGQMKAWQKHQKRQKEHRAQHS